MSRYIMPSPVLGVPQFPLGWPEINWLQALPKNTYFFLWANDPGSDNINLPLGHPLYVITFHQERFDHEWILDQSSKIDAPILILNDGSCYDLPLPPNVRFYNYYSWHHHIDQIMRWFPERRLKNVRYKISNVCNRITQSKMLVFTALMEYHDPSTLLVKLGDWIEEKNVHHWDPTGVKDLDELTERFREKYLGRVIQVDDFCNNTDNIQSKNSNPWQPFYTESALHLVSESYHYSLMHTRQGPMIHPGPQFSEKLYKCLIAGTPFIPVGQFQSYKFLRELGLKFDYGDLDLSWDDDPGNLSRLVGVVDLIKNLKNYDISDIVTMTQESTDHNTEMIWSGEFYKKCQAHNMMVRDQILEEFGS
jgi:hypothetical protein